MKGPAQVRFPGEDKRRKLKMKGIKKASETIQKRLRKNLDSLLEEPEKVIPTITDRDFVVATVAAPTIIKEPEKPAEEVPAEGAEGEAAAEGAEATGKEVDAAKKDEKGKDGSAEKKPDEKKSAEKKPTEKK